LKDIEVSNYAKGSYVQEDRQRRYNVTFRRVLATNDVEEKQ